MNTHDFLLTPAWMHKRSEVRFEILAVCLPVVLYVLSASISHATEKPVSFSYLMGIPDAFFGGCILFALTIIQAFGFRDVARYSSLRPSQSIVLWRWLALSGLIACSILSGFAIIYHPAWSLPLGLISIYLGSLGYKSVVFCREYLEAAIVLEQGSAQTH